MTAAFSPAELAAMFAKVERELALADTDSALDVLVRSGLRAAVRAGQRPCLDAIVHDTTFNAGDLRTDARWPRLGRAAFEQTGIASMLSFRMFFEAPDEDVVAGLNIYSREPHAFGEASEAVGMLLASGVEDQPGDRCCDGHPDAEVQDHSGRRPQPVADGQPGHASQGRRHRKVADIAGSVAEIGELPERSARHA